MAKKQNKKFKSLNAYQQYYTTTDNAEKVKQDKYYRIGANSVKMAIKKDL